MSKKTLVIIDHPHFDKSRVNRRWLDELRACPEEFTLHNLQSAYPRHPIDPMQEHSLLEQHGLIVLQFPLFWYNAPAMTSSWLETVLTRGWAYGDSYRLEGRPVALGVTCGSAEGDYGAEGRHLRPVADYLNNLIHAFEFVHAVFAGIYCFYGAGDLNTGSDAVARLQQSAAGYLQFLRERAVGIPA